MDLVREWAFDQNTYDVLDYLDDYHRQHDQQQINLNTNWIFNPSFTFYIQTRKLDWLHLTAYHKDTDTTSNTQFYYAISNDWGELQKSYDPVLKFDDGGRLLLVHK